MEKLLIAVGSTRKPKLGAVSQALESFASKLRPAAPYEVVGIEVESGVSHTPSTRQEAFRLALIAAFAPFYNNQMYQEVSAATARS